MRMPRTGKPWGKSWIYRSSMISMFLLCHNHDCEILSNVGSVFSYEKGQSMEWYKDQLALKKHIDSDDPWSANCGRSMAASEVIPRISTEVLDHVRSIILCPRVWESEGAHGSRAHMLVAVLLHAPPSFGRSHSWRICRWESLSSMIESRDCWWWP